MARNYGLWGAIAGICLLALLGVRSAVNWLNGSTTANREADQTVAIEGNGQTQTNARFGDQSETRVGETLTFSPLETAGTYVQRQKRAERDAVVAQTNVEAVPLTTDNAVPSAPNTRVEQPAPANVSNTQPSQTRPASSSPAVPALW